MIQINVVRSVYYQDEIIDIEIVTKAFLVAKRMIDLTNNLGSSKIIQQPPIIKDKRNKKNNYFPKPKFPILTVKGFNWIWVKF